MRMSRRALVWIVLGALAAALAAAAGARGEGAVVPLAVWLVVTAALVLRAAWRRLTYRVGTRLFLSYLLLGLTPFLICAVLAGGALYMAMGQYTSVRLGFEIRELRDELDEGSERVLEALALGGRERARAELARIAAEPGGLAARAVWQARLGGLEVALPEGADLPLPGWLPPSGHADGIVVHDDRAFAMVASADAAGDVVVGLLPLDRDTADALSRGLWFDVGFLVTGGADSLALTTATGGEEGGSRIVVGDTELPASSVWGAWRHEGSGLLDRPWVIWFRVAENVRDLATGEGAGEVRVVSLLRTAPRLVWEDFVLQRYELGREIQAVLAALGAFFLLVYGVAFVVAGSMIASIARSTARLTRGAREVSAGRLDWRIPVRRHDQLGDLAASFNSMTASVERMLAEVAEKERLARELELAREIQESLLPTSPVRVGPVEVNGVLLPAAEVGGDTFDVLPVGEHRLVVAVGDVAGHGLSTGLLMAGLKSAVAALVREGRSGADLVDRVNVVLREQGRRRLMATLAVAELDLERGEVRITNAGHPPPFLIPPHGEVVELEAPALPLGFALSRPASTRAPMLPGSRLVMYSDGLVEAADEAGEMLGYEAVAAVLAEIGSQAPATELIQALLQRVRRHTGDRPLADDLTIVVVDRVG